MQTAEPEGVSLVSALAEASPAFTRTPIPVSPAMSPSDRVILALAELTPAFVPDFDNPVHRGADGRPWYRHPVTLILALGVLLGIPAAVLAGLPHGSEAITGTTQTTTRATTSVPVTQSSTTGTPAVTQAALTGISVTPAEVTLAAGESRQLRAIGTYDDGSTAEVPGPVEWTSTDSSVADVNSAGRVTAADVAPQGSRARITIRATSKGFSGTATVIVTAAPPPSTTTVTSTVTMTVTTTVPTPTVTTTVPTTVTTTVTGPPVFQTHCLDNTTVTSPAACPPPPTRHVN